jgi:3-oxoacyl-[acyl-carrier protein] reductase
LVAQLRKDHEVNRPEAGYLRISIHQVDLSNSDECIKLCEDVRKEHGRSIDILISNAGRGKRITDILDIPLEEFEQYVRVEVFRFYINIIQYNQSQPDSLFSLGKRRR